MALMGNFRNFISSIESVGVLGLQNGIIQDIAVNNKERESIYMTITTVFFTVILIGSFLGFLLILFSKSIGIYLFESNEYQLAIQMLGCLLPFQLLTFVINSVLNGLSAYKKVVFISIITYVVGLIISLLFMWKFDILGAMIAVLTTTFLLFFISMFYLSSLLNLKDIFYFSNVSKKHLFSILPLGIMTLFSAIIAPTIYIFIRNYIIEVTSLQAAGFYEAISRISGFYFMFIATLMTFYFLPELSKTATRKDIFKLFKEYYTFLIPLFTLGLVVIFLLKNFIITLLLTSEFEPVSQLFFWQLIGDFFRALSLILGMYFFAKKLLKPYFITEIISFIVLISSSYYFIGKYGVEGAVLAYAITYFLYFAVLVVYFKYQFSKNEF
jgi:PST family polysaccharide transporter